MAYEAMFAIAPDEVVREATREPGEHEEEHEDMLQVRQDWTLFRRVSEVNGQEEEVQEEGS
jgi:hypothetical protein